MKKKALVTVISIVLVTIGVFYYINDKKEKEIQAYNQQVEDFEYSLKEIGSQTPEEVNSYTLEKYQTKGDPLNKLPFSSLQRVMKYSFESESQDYLKLTIEMIVFKFKNSRDEKPLTSYNEQLTFDEVREIVEDIKTRPNDKLNSLIIESCQKAIDNQSKYIQMSSDEQYY